MFDLAVLANGVKSISGLYGMLSKIQEIRQNQAVLDKLEEILALKSTLLDAKEEILNLREVVKDLRAKQDMSKALAFDPGRGFFRADIDGKKLTYCTKCWVEHQRLAPLEEMSHGNFCHVCRSFYSDPNYSPPSQPRTPNPYTGS